MQLAFSPEQEELRDVARSFLDAASPETEVRRLMVTDQRHDPAVWARMAAEIGVQGLALDEAVGGQGFGFRDLAVVLEEAGRALLCAPLLSTVVAAPTLVAAIGADSAGTGELLGSIAAGDTIVAVAVPADAVKVAPGETGVRAERHDGAWQLRGESRHVIDGHVADVVLVVADTDDGLGVFRCDRSVAGLDTRALPTLDLTRAAARVAFDATPASPVGEPGDAAAAAVARTLDVIRVALAVESVGGAQRCLDMSVAYAKERVQFGRPIGSFQAVKHRCADMLLAVETARSAAYAAAWAVDATAPGGGGADEDVDLAAEASLAKSTADEAYVAVANSTIQVHGGIGFTWEHPAHLYLKRARSTALVFGDATAHRDRLGDLLDL